MPRPCASSRTRSPNRKATLARRSAQTAGGGRGGGGWSGTRGPPAGRSSGAGPPLGFLRLLSLRSCVMLLTLICGRWLHCVYALQHTLGNQVVYCPPCTPDPAPPPTQTPQRHDSGPPTPPLAPRVSPPQLHDSTEPVDPPDAATCRGRRRRRRSQDQHVRALRSTRQHGRGCRIGGALAAIQGAVRQSSCTTTWEAAAACTR